jgi:hypothetical protein
MTASIWRNEKDKEARALAGYTLRKATMYSDCSLHGIRGGIRRIRRIRRHASPGGLGVLSLARFAAYEEG